MFKVKTRRHRQYLHDFIDGESDLLANSSVSLGVNYRNRKEETKNRRENTDMNGRTIALDEIEIGWDL